MGKNNITTQGYFIRRLRNEGYFASRVYDRYGDHDSRRWTIVISPNNASVFITCHNNINEWPYKGLYEFDDGGLSIPRGYHINTDSVEVIVKHLQEFDIPVEGNLNNSNGRRRKQLEQASEEKSVQEEA